ncbi:MAG: TSUP family transporter [Christensenellaceae bacterium]
MDTKKQRFLKKGGALLAGMASGFFGSGGTVAIPLLRALGYGEKRAHTAAISFLFPVIAISFFVYLVFGSIGVAVFPVALGMMIGGLIGSKLLRILPEEKLGWAFTVLLLLSGIRSLL